MLRAHVTWRWLVGVLGTHTYTNNEKSYTGSARGETEAGAPSANGGAGWEETVQPVKAGHPAAQGGVHE